MLARERFSWIWLCSLVIVLGTYFVHAASAPPDAAPTMLERISRLAAALGTLGVVAAAAWFFVLRGARTAGEPAFDERDRAIAWRSSRAAYLVLMSGTIVVGCVMPFEHQGWELINASVLAIALAEVVNHGMVVFGYRRGWRD